MRKQTYKDRLNDLLSMAERVDYFNMLHSGNYDETIANQVHEKLLSIAPKNVKHETAAAALETRFVYVSYNMTDKMKMIPAVSTSNLFNKFCQILKKCDGAICEHCFADGQQKQYYMSMLHSLRNLELLACNMWDVVPIINSTVCRIEAFGDLVNVNQAIFYLLLIEQNKHCFFGWWTKHPDLIAKALKEHGYTKETGKPQNFNVVLSSLMLNHETTSKYWFVDKTFTVFDDQTIESEHVNINCGGRKCITCLNCYSKNDVAIVNERKK